RPLHFKRFVRAAGLRRRRSQAWLERFGPGREACFELSLIAVWPPAAEQLVKQYSQGVDVTRGGNWPGPNLLGAGVLGRHRFRADAGRLEYYRTKIAS